MSHDVFISYSSKNKVTADAICHVLEENEIKCWIAPRDLVGGVKYGNVIEDAIKNCKAFVIIFSEESRISPWVESELNLAFTDRRTIVPFKIDSSLLAGEMRLMLNNKHWIEAYPNPELKFKDLIEAISFSIGKPRSIANEIFSNTKQVIDNSFLGDTSTFVDKRDGHEYKWVRIGKQIWMAENLQATTYNDGDPIPNVKNDDKWGTLKTGAYCNYDNDKYNAKKYGCLYNWYAVDSEKLAPQGWHVPSKGEWNELVEFLKENGYGNKTDGEIGKSLASKTGWEEFDKKGVIGHKQQTNNSSGFTALPCGSRNQNGKYVNFEFGCDWWSSTESKHNAAWSYDLVSSFSSMGADDLLKAYGFSVRCVRD